MTKNVVDLGLDIKTHLCNSCVHKFNVCEELQYAYGSGEGEREGMPNICACDSFDPNIVGRSTKLQGLSTAREERRTEPKGKEPTFMDIWD